MCFSITGKKSVFDYNFKKKERGEKKIMRLCMCPCVTKSKLKKHVLRKEKISAHNSVVCVQV